jgi:hypothetical protein
MNTRTSPLSVVKTPEQLVSDLIKAKQIEAHANKDRVALEEQLIALLGQREEGSQTHEMPNGMKVTITAKQTYKADVALLIQLASSLPESLRPLKVETKLDETGAKFLRANEPAIWAQLSAAITVTPAKTAVSIKA